MRKKNPDPGAGRTNGTTPGSKRSRPLTSQRPASKASNLPLEEWPVFLGIKEFFARPDVISAILIAVFFVAAISALFIAPQRYLRTVNEGDISLKDIYAPYDFQYYWGVNEEATQKAREEAALTAPYTLRRDREKVRQMQRKLTDFFAVLSDQRKSAAPISERSLSLREQAGVDLSDKDVKMLLEYPDPAKLEMNAFKVQDNVFLVGVIGKGDKGSLKEGGVIKVEMVDEEGVVLERATDDLITSDTLSTVIDNYTAAYFTDRRVRQAVADLVVTVTGPNLVPDPEGAKLRKEEAYRNAPAVYDTFTAKKNELIAGKGQKITARHIAQITELTKFMGQGKQSAFFLGMLLLFLLLGLAGAIYMNFVGHGDFLNHTRDIAIILVNLFLMVLAAEFIIRSPQPSYFIPMAGMGMMILLLTGFNGAFISVFLMSFLVSILAGGKVSVAVVLMVGGMVGIFAVRNARRRVDIFYAGVLAGVAKFLAIVSIGLINGMAMKVFVSEGVWGIASGVFSGFIVMGLLPVFEHAFKVPTNISLLELSDMNHPVLKELAIEAPGTYHHSIMVGNLAEAACDAIGANSLLARVGAYYHDIGKISKPSYFSENEMGAPSKHSKLTPSMSALIIAKHVKEGLEVARKYKLNSAIIDFIMQHHGDSLISFFYQKAIEKSEQGEKVKEENFRYPGPRPQTKETAIVLLADAVEAASRTLEDPTPASIGNLVRKIVNNKFIDGQLDECDLTLRDMHEIADCFVRVLMSVFHTRITYPEDKADGSKG